MKKLLLKKKLNTLTKIYDYNFKYGNVIKINNLMNNKINKYKNNIKILETKFNDIILKLELCKAEQYRLKNEVIKQKKIIKKLSFDIFNVKNQFELMSIINIIDEEFNMLDKENIILNCDLINIQKTNDDLLLKIKDINEKKQKNEKLLIKINMYEKYISYTNYEGLPYEVMKKFLPQIKNEINNILNNFVNFNIDFLVYDASKITENKENLLKPKHGSIELNIIYPNMKAYNIKLASGFEKFTINLMLRIVFGQISMIAKPNFLVIDEGWSCMDTLNLNNISIIINAIKERYDFILIISHLDALKNEAEHIINIDIENKMSAIKNIYV